MRSAACTSVMPSACCGSSCCFAASLPGRTDQTASRQPALLPAPRTADDPDHLGRALRGGVNKDFDYVAYLDALHAYGLNYTRIYPGYLIEPKDKYIKGNTLAPDARGADPAVGAERSARLSPGRQPVRRGPLGPGLLRAAQRFRGQGRPSGASWSRSASTTPSTRTRGRCRRLFPENNIQGDRRLRLQGRPDPQASRSGRSASTPTFARSPRPSIRSTTSSWKSATSRS